MNYNRGSLWNKWDLHVHTPSSIVHRYHPGAEDKWERFIRELASLPEPFKVLGINDYLFLDGYRRVAEEKASGRLPNIDLLFPVIELRLAAFAGTDTDLSKINLHVIFSDELGADVIEAQFVSSLFTKFRLLPEFAGLKATWKAIPTRESLAELGDLIIQTSPEQRRADFGDPLLVGFSNLVFELSDVEEALSSPLFEGRFIIAIGKAEWADKKWTIQSIAAKKHLINSASIVFSAAQDVDSYNASRKALRDAGVNHHLLDCSDAHAYSDTAEKDRIGNCNTWLKADTTFRGLLHALKEFEHRVCMSSDQMGHWEPFAKTHFSALV